MKLKALLIILLTYSMTCGAQELTTLRHKTIQLCRDTIKLDSMMLFPSSVKVLAGDTVISPNLYKLDSYNALFIPSSTLKSSHNSVAIQYRIWPYPIHMPRFHKELSQIISTPYSNRFDNTSSLPGENTFLSSSLQKRGSLSRGLSFGNNQDVVVNSNLNLQLSGSLNQRIRIMAALSDNNIPLQPDGNTQQIQDFDRIFIKLYDHRHEVTLGDYALESPTGTFMKFYKKVQGGKFTAIMGSDSRRNNQWKTTLSGSLSKGKFNRMKIQGIEGNQGPYRLVGQNQETHIIVVAGTEKVYLNGKALTRGQKNDYIINYNTAELQFTPNSPITRNSRITVEFEYSEENYARFLIFNSTEYTREKSRFWINIYSEQDSRNQPLDQKLDNSQKELLSQIGDQLELARIERVEKVSYSNDRVLYKKITRDAGGISYQVYQHSTDPDDALYQLTFSYVGENMGNYTPTTSAANGRVYQWVDPVEGQPQGNYEPVVQLITPQKRQLITLGGEFKTDSLTYARFELALSNKDLNTFSSQGDKDNKGYALTMDLGKRFALRDSLIGLNTNLRYHYLHRNFSQLTPFRPVEFDREWNLTSPSSPEEEHLIDISGDISHAHRGQTGYQFSLLNRGDDYKGVRHHINTSFSQGGFKLLFEGGLLNTKQEERDTRFLRHNMEITQSLSILTLGINTQSEHNKWTLNADNTILANSFAFHSYKIFLRNADQNINKFSIHYQLRKDYLPYQLKLRSQSRSQDFGMGFKLLKNKNNQLKSTVLYRKLDLINPDITGEKPENTLLGRIEHQLRMGKGSVISRSFYEIGSGLEAEKEFVYLEVAPGQGIYRWTDYNNNQLKELNEFEVATFRDEASYIRIFTPTNNYQRVYTNQFNQSIHIRLHRLSSLNGIGTILAALSNRLSYRISQKNTNNSFKSYANPFKTNWESSELLSLTTNIQNTLSFKKKGAKTAWDYLYLKSKNKQLLSNGFDSNEMSQNGIRFRWTIAGSHKITNRIDKGKRQFISEYFEQKNYNIKYLTEKLNILFQPSRKFQWGLDYQYQTKKNKPGLEESRNHNFGCQMSYSLPRGGNMQLNAHYLNIHFNQSPNTPISYQMLEGFLPGNNATWNLGYTQKVSKIFHLNISYNGRYSEGEPTIHTGNMELRAQF